MADPCSPLLDQPDHSMSHSPAGAAVTDTVPFTFSPSGGADGDAGADEGRTLETQAHADDRIGPIHLPSFEQDNDEAESSSRAAAQEQDEEEPSSPAIFAEADPDTVVVGRRGSLVYRYDEPVLAQAAHAQHARAYSHLDAHYVPKQRHQQEQEQDSFDASAAADEPPREPEEIAEEQPQVEEEAEEVEERQDEDQHHGVDADDADAGVEFASGATGAPAEAAYESESGVDASHLLDPSEIPPVCEVEPALLDFDLELVTPAAARAATSFMPLTDAAAAAADPPSAAERARAEFILAAPVVDEQYASERETQAREQRMIEWDLQQQLSAAAAVAAASSDDAAAAAAAPSATATRRIRSPQLSPDDRGLLDESFIIPADPTLSMDPDNDGDDGGGGRDGGGNRYGRTGGARGDVTLSAVDLRSPSMQLQLQHLRREHDALTDAASMAALQRFTPPLSRSGKRRAQQELEAGPPDATAGAAAAHEEDLQHLAADHTRSPPLPAQRAHAAAAAAAAAQAGGAQLPPLSNFSLALAAAAADDPSLRPQDVDGDMGAQDDDGGSAMHSFRSVASNLSSTSSSLGGRVRKASAASTAGGGAVSRHRQTLSASVAGSHRAATSLLSSSRSSSMSHRHGSTTPLASPPAASPGATRTPGGRNARRATANPQGWSVHAVANSLHPSGSATPVGSTPVSPQAHHNATAAAAAVAAAAAAEKHAAVVRELQRTNDELRHATEHLHSVIGENQRLSSELSMLQLEMGLNSLDGNSNQRTSRDGDDAQSQAQQGQGSGSPSQLRFSLLSPMHSPVARGSNGFGSPILGTWGGGAGILSPSAVGATPRSSSSSSLSPAHAEMSLMQDFVRAHTQMATVSWKMHENRVQQLRAQRRLAAVDESIQHQNQRRGDHDADDGASSFNAQGRAEAAQTLADLSRARVELLVELRQAERGRRRAHRAWVAYDRLHGQGQGQGQGGASPGSSDNEEEELSSSDPPASVSLALAPPVSRSIDAFSSPSSHGRKQSQERVAVLSPRRPRSVNGMVSPSSIAAGADADPSSPTSVGGNLSIPQLLESIASLRAHNQRLEREKSVLELSRARVDQQQQQMHEAHGEQVRLNEAALAQAAAEEAAEVAAAAQREAEEERARELEAAVAERVRVEVERTLAERERARQIDGAAAATQNALAESMRAEAAAARQESEQLKLRLRALEMQMANSASAPSAQGGAAATRSVVDASHGHGGVSGLTSLPPAHSRVPSMAGGPFSSSSIFSAAHAHPPARPSSSSYYAPGSAPGSAPASAAPSQRPSRAVSPVLHPLPAPSAASSAAAAASHQPNPLEVASLAALDPAASSGGFFVSHLHQQLLTPARERERTREVQRPTHALPQRGDGGQKSFDSAPTATTERTTAPAPANHLLNDTEQARLDSEQLAAIQRRNQAREAAQRAQQRHPLHHTLPEPHADVSFTAPAAAAEARTAPVSPVSALGARAALPPPTEPAHSFSLSQFAALQSQQQSQLRAQAQLLEEAKERDRERTRQAGGAGGVAAAPRDLDSSATQMQAGDRDWEREEHEHAHDERAGDTDTTTKQMMQALALQQQALLFQQEALQQQSQQLQLAQRAQGGQHSQQSQSQAMTPFAAFTPVPTPSAPVAFAPHDLSTSFSSSSDSLVLLPSPAAITAAAAAAAAAAASSNGLDADPDLEANLRLMAENQAQIDEVDSTIRDITARTMAQGQDAPPMQAGRLTVAALQAQYGEQQVRALQAQAQAHHQQQQQQHQQQQQQQPFSHGSPQPAGSVMQPQQPHQQQLQQQPHPQPSFSPQPSVYEQQLVRAYPQLQLQMQASQQQQVQQAQQPQPAQLQPQQHHLQAQPGEHEQAVHPPQMMHPDFQTPHHHQHSQQHQQQAHSTSYGPAVGGGSWASPVYAHEAAGSRPLSPSFAQGRYQQQQQQPQMQQYPPQTHVQAQHAHSLSMGPSEMGGAFSRVGSHASLNGQAYEPAATAVGVLSAAPPVPASAVRPTRARPNGAPQAGMDGSAPSSAQASRVRSSSRSSVRSGRSVASSRSSSQPRTAQSRADPVAHLYTNKNSRPLTLNEPQARAVERMVQSATVGAAASAGGGGAPTSAVDAAGGGSTRVSEGHAAMIRAQADSFKRSQAEKLASLLALNAQDSNAVLLKPTGTAPSSSFSSGGGGASSASSSLKKKKVASSVSAVVPGRARARTPVQHAPPPSAYLHEATFQQRVEETAVRSFAAMAPYEANAMQQQQQQRQRPSYGAVRAGELEQSYYAEQQPWAESQQQQQPQQQSQGHLHAYPQNQRASSPARQARRLDDAALGAAPGPPTRSSTPGPGPAGVAHRRSQTSVGGGQSLPPWGSPLASPHSAHQAASMHPTSSYALEFEDSHGHSHAHLHAPQAFPQSSPLAAPVVKGASGARFMNRVGTPAYSPAASPGPSAQVAPASQPHAQHHQPQSQQQWSAEREYANGSEALAVLEQTRARYRAQQLEQQQQKQTQQQQQQQQHY